MTDEKPADPASAALAAAKAAAMEKVKDGNALRRQQESKGAAERRSSGARASRRSGDRTDWDEPLRFGESVGELLSVRGWEGELAVARVLAEWGSIVGPDLAAHASPVGLNGGVLSLQAESTAWATQVRLLAPQIIKAVAERFGEDIVTSVTARGPSGPPTQPGAWKVRGGRGPRDTYG